MRNLRNFMIFSLLSIVLGIFGDSVTNNVNAQTSQPSTPNCDPAVTTTVSSSTVQLSLPGSPVTITNFVTTVTVTIQTSTGPVSSTHSSYSTSGPVTAEITPSTTVNPVTGTVTTSVTIKFKPTGTVVEVVVINPCGPFITWFTIVDGLPVGPFSRGGENGGQPTSRPTGQNK
ncbi:MAG: hypothetical protein HY606_13285 [Planctomycetes bacterium]|nr:hypothetical protein [Planctomycetota bacterium]